MRILVTTNKSNFEKLDLAVEAVKNKIGTAAEVVNGAEVPWDSILETESGWDGVFDWVNRSFSALVLVEGEEGGLGRGTYEMAKKFLTANKSVGIVRDGEVIQVKEVRVFDRNRWADMYGIVVT